MVRRVTPSQFRSKMQQHVRKINQAIDKVNRANRQFVTTYNNEVRKHNAAVRQRRQAYLSAVAQYNRAANSHNAKVRSNRTKLAQQLRSLEARSSQSYPAVRTSTIDLLARYERVATEEVRSLQHAELIRLAEVESSNSAEVAEKLLDEEPSDLAAEEEPSGILDYLSDLSEPTFPK